MTTEELKALPKVELHCHLDGSLSREFIESRLGRAVQPEELSVSDDCTSLAEYLEKFSLPGQCIMDEKGLEGAGYDVLKSMSQENVCYAEIRFAPLLSETESMNCRSVIEALLKGLERGKKDFGVDFGDEKAYLVFGIAGVGNDHLDLLGNVCEILEDEDALEQLKTTSDMNYVLEHLQ